MLVPLNTWSGTIYVDNARHISICNWSDWCLLRIKKCSMIMQDKKTNKWTKQGMDKWRDD